ncbi:MAG: DUF1269 domain-containing protein [Acidimicrobiales bacterium]
MPAYDTYVLIGAVYASSDSAAADYDAVKSLYYEWNLIDTFDAAIVTKRDGKSKILKKHEQPTRSGGWRGAGIGLATGAVVALFPAAAIGSGLLAATTGGGAVIGAIAGHVLGGMSRNDLKELGERLDSGQSGLIVVAATDVSGRVENALTNASDLIRKELESGEEQLAAEIEDAQKEVAGS